MTDWYAVATPEQQTRLLAAWPGAPIENLDLAAMLLEVAQLQVWAFAPESGSDPDTSDMYGGDVYGGATAESAWVTPPTRLVYAQLAQAKSLWSAGMADENGNIGTEGYSFVPRPLDKTVRTIIRPTSGVASVL